MRALLELEELELDDELLLELDEELLLDSSVSKGCAANGIVEIVLSFGMKAFSLTEACRLATPPPPLALFAPCLRLAAARRR